MKKLTSILLIIVILTLMLTTSSCQMIDNISLKFQRVDGGYIISEYNNRNNLEFDDHYVKIPSTHRGKPVIGIGDDVFANESFKSITIPDSVTSIGAGAFSSCYALTSITIPDSVTSIGYGAFSMCGSLTNIEVDKNNQYYKSIDGNLYTKDGKTLLYYASANRYTSFVIPDSVTSIGDYAFYSCDYLKSITIPDSVTSIGDYAFYWCYSLASITFEGTVEQWNSISFDYNWEGYVHVIEVICSDGTVELE